ncbi:MAG: hypothetical protein EHM40_15255 [Chloroflexi bacterium]|nr:MAG: hypothetical protein EHM40_15255 [Chloroflexota bacterium]
MITKFLDRVPRFLSLLGLLGIVGLAGLFDPQLFRFSALSFLSYVCYFRFMRWFVKPSPPLTATGILVPVVGIMIWIVPQVIYPELLTIVPMFGFIGFAGFLGLYEPADGSQMNTAA